jgi:hypothetical protein
LIAWGATSDSRIGSDGIRKINACPLVLTEARHNGNKIGADAVVSPDGGLPTTSVGSGDYQRVAATARASYHGRSAARRDALQNRDHNRRRRS